MAAKKESFRKLEIEFIIEENNNNAANSTLVIECIKYLLYERHQIPATVDQIFLNYDNDSSQSSRRTDSRKKTQLLKDLKCLFTNIEELFASTMVYSALIMFGSTAVSPKECYQINFLSAFDSTMAQPSVSDSKSKKMSRKFLRKLVMTEELREFKEISSTPLLVFVQTSRNVSSQWFRPKHSFKVPSRGNFCSILMRNEGMGEEEERTENDRIWLQAPVTVKGYYETMKDVTNVFSELWE